MSCTELFAAICFIDMSIIKKLPCVYTRSYIQYTIPLGTSKKARPIKAGSHNLHYHTNDLNTEKNPSPAVT